MKFITAVALTLFCMTAFANRPFKGCGLKSNTSIVFVSPNGTIKQYTWVPSELGDIDLHNDIKNGSLLCVEGVLTDKDILSARKIED